MQSPLIAIAAVLFFQNHLILTSGAIKLIFNGLSFVNSFFISGSELVLSQNDFEIGKRIAEGGIEF